MPATPDRPRGCCGCVATILAWLVVAALVLL